MVEQLVMGGGMEIMLHIMMERFTILYPMHVVTIRNIIKALYKIFNYISLISSCVYGFHFYFLSNNKFLIHNNYYSDSVEHSYERIRMHNVCMLMKLWGTKSIQMWKCDWSMWWQLMGWNGTHIALALLWANRCFCCLATLANEVGGKF